MRRVVFLNHSAANSGGEIALATIARALSASMSVKVVLLENGPLVDSLNGASVDVKVVEMPATVGAIRRGRSASTAPFHLRRFARSAVLSDLDWGDVLYTNSQKAHVLAMLRDRPAGQKWVLHQREYVSRRSLGMKAFCAAQLAIARSDLCICNSASTRASVRYAGFSTKRVVSTPIDLERFRGVRGSRSEAEEFRVLMVATVTPQKGHDVLLRALKDLRIDRTVRVRIAGSATFGDHAYLELLRLMTDEVNRSDVPITVEMLGHRNDVHVLMGDSDVLVAPSRVGEGMGQVLVQARAAGLPVIASDIPGYRDLVTPGVNGLLVPDGDHSAFASAMRMIALGSVILHPSLGDGLLVGFDESVTNESISRLLAEVSP